MSAPESDQSESDNRPDSDSPSPYVPRMGAESGFDVSEVHVPLRVSGFFCLVLGLVSAFSLLAIPLLVVPLVAILIGMFALRPSRQGRPVGTTAAKVGIFCAVLFGACGASFAWFKQKTFGDQAEYFARQYFDVVAQGDMELAAELRKDFVNRFSADMSLKAYYENNSSAKEGLDELYEDSVTGEAQDAGVGGNWQLTKAPRVYHKYGNDRVELLFINADKAKPRKIEVIMQCKTNPETGEAHWHVFRSQMHMKPIYAESIL